MKIDYNVLKKISLIIAAIIFAIFTVLILLYFLILPSLFNSKKVANFVAKIIKEKLNYELVIENQKLDVSLKPQIGLHVGKFALINNSEKIAELEDFNFEFCFCKIFKKQIGLKEISAKKLNVKVDKLLSLVSKQEKKEETKPLDYKLYFINPTIKLDELKITYFLNKALLNLEANNINLKTVNNEKFFEFSSVIDLIKNNQNYAKIKVNADDEIKLSKDRIVVDELLLLINQSDIRINSEIALDKLYFSAISKKFNLEDVFKLINCDFLIAQGSDMLSPLKNPVGNVSFNVSFLNGKIDGLIDVNHTGVSIKDVSLIPIKINDGKIKISNDKIDFLDLIGYYGKNKANKVKITGDIKDYFKTFDSNITIESLITNEFFKDYLAPLINNTALYVSKPSTTKVIYKSKNNIMDIIWFAQIDKNVDFGVTNEKSALSNFDRAVLGEFQIKENKIDIKNINYYISQNIVRGVKLQPILTANALMDLTGKIDKAGIAFGREMPCEFLNVFIGQPLFKKGTIKGKINVAFKNDIPYLDADMEINKTLIPTQRMFLSHAYLKTDDNIIKLDTKGIFKRAKFDFNGKIKNELKAPYIVKNLNLEVDNLDIERILVSLNNQNSQVQNDVKIESEEDLKDDDYMFDTNLIRIEDCDFSLLSGKYKDINFGNIKANLTLDDKGILNVKSNRFDIAKGVSSLKLVADLKELKYDLKLGVKDIDSNLMAKTLFNLDKEITGKATGLIALNSDKTLKLNGDIKFVVNDGTIGKIGLVEYILKIASVFRNPIVMVSPATIMDIISIPEGKFDKISGTIKIKDNVLAPIDIKSYSKSLSALIKGKFDLEKHDASLRIYTRFSTDKKTAFNLLRQLSLSSLANKVKMNSRNDANYYASELKDLPEIEVDNDKTQVFLTQVEGDIEHFNFLSSLKKIK